MATESSSLMLNKSDNKRFRFIRIQVLFCLTIVELPIRQFRRSSAEPEHCLPTRHRRHEPLSREHRQWQRWRREPLDVTVCTTGKWRYRQETIVDERAVFNAIGLSLSSMTRPSSKSLEIVRLSSSRSPVHLRRTLALSISSRRGGGSEQRRFGVLVGVIRHRTD